MSRSVAVTSIAVAARGRAVVVGLRVATTGLRRRRRPWDSGTDVADGVVALVGPVPEGAGRELALAPLVTWVVDLPDWTALHEGAVPVIPVAPVRIPTSGLLDATATVDVPAGLRSLSGCRVEVEVLLAPRGMLRATAPVPLR